MKKISALLLCVVFFILNADFLCTSTCLSWALSERTIGLYGVLHNTN